MSPFECVREPEVLEAIDACRWPAEVSAELRAHAAACGVCGDLVAVVPLLREDAAAAREDAIVPPAGRVWWRAELRARNEAALAAQRPMTLVQGLAAACTLGVLVALVTLTMPGLLAWVLRAAQEARQDLPALAAFAARWSHTVALVVGMWLVLGPVAVYFLLRGDGAGERR